ncbi:MAG: hypothetical protein RL293_855 [Bacteroidota bacterium]
MGLTSAEEIHVLKQKNDILNGAPFLDVVRPCRLGDGIIQLTSEEEHELTQRFSQVKKELSFFIPASGSGSRMFQFLYDYLNQTTETNQAQTEQFIRRISSFAFYKRFPSEVKEKIENFSWSIEDLISYVLGEGGLNFGLYPKGLIPFHSLGPFMLNPFQEQLIQGSQLVQGPIDFHFTIQSTFEAHFQSAIQSLSDMTGDVYPVTYSEQDPKTNSFAFYADGTLALGEDEEPIQLPAGHGTLLTNLARIQSDYVLVKNIDNLQHFSQSAASNSQWKILVGLLDQLKEAFSGLAKNPSLVEFEQLNKLFHFLPENELKSEAELMDFISRPMRVCGMVRNEGQPGGGPFYVEKNGEMRKQIVEKAQLANTDKVNALLMQSTHFNPVMMVLDFKDFHGEHYDLTQFTDEEAFFIVEKSHLGKSIRFIEQPGLWNGGMAKWNTIFIEIPNEVFTPVKTVLDLLQNTHQAI